MKRVLAVTALAATTVLISATSALAGDYGPGVEGSGGRPQETPEAHH